MTTRVQPALRRVRGHPARLAWALVVLAALVAAAALLGDRLVSGEATAARPELQRILDDAVTGSGRIAPGAAAYVSGPHGTWVGAAGLANVGTRAPMGSEARVRLESVSKIYTAAVVVQLDQERRLRLEDTVERWLPGLFPYGDRITIRQLLTMSSGLVDDNDLLASPAAARAYLANVRDEALRARLTAIAARIERDPTVEISPTWAVRFAAWQPLLFEPGTAYHYSNIGYDVLGLIAARAGGRPFPALLRERLFVPLGLEDTAYDPQGPIAGPHATGYQVAADGSMTDVSDVHPWKGPDGGVVADADDTAAFLTALMRGRLVDADHLRRMRLDALWLGGEDSGCAGDAYGWSGGGNGYKTNVWVNRDGTRVAVLLLNARVTGDGADARASTAMRRLYCAA
ncbi:MAG: serine hydrolase domain-containing protein [Pseudomonadota bacterium]